jgi:hypothetical protein
LGINSAVSQEMGNYVNTMEELNTRVLGMPLNMWKPNMAPPLPCPPPQQKRNKFLAREEVAELVGSVINELHDEADKDLFIN